MGNDSTQDSTFRDTPATESDLAEQRALINQLKSLDEQIEQLQKRRNALEVEFIAAEAALRATPANIGRSINQERLADLALAWHEQRQIEAVVKDLEPSKSTASASQGKGRLQAGRDALISWLDAFRSERPSGGFKFAYAMLFMATLAVLWAAIALHPVLLLALLGIGAVLAFLRSSEQNTTWLRLGAKRRYVATALALPLEWEETAVRQRLTELNSQLQQLDADKATADLRMPHKEGTPEHHEQLAEKLAAATRQLDSRLLNAGVKLSELDPEMQQWLEHLATARLAKQELDRITTLLRTTSEGRTAGQEAVFRFLSRQGEAPEYGAADTKSLNLGLDRVAKRLR